MNKKQSIGSTFIGVGLSIIILLFIEKFIFKSQFDVRIYVFAVMVIGIFLYIKGFYENKEKRGKE